MQKRRSYPIAVSRLPTNFNHYPPPLTPLPYFPILRSIHTCAPVRDCVQGLPMRSSWGGFCFVTWSNHWQ